MSNDDIEIDEIWEIELFGQYSHWTTEEQYKNIKSLMMDKDVDKNQTAVTFTTLCGAELTILLSNISDLNSSNKEMRIKGRAISKKYKEEWEEKKEAWEE